MALNVKKQSWKDRWKRAKPRPQSFLTSVLGEQVGDGKSNPYANYLSRSVLLEETQPPKNLRATINLIITMIATFVVWASVTKLDERAVAPGEILPINFVQPVQHLEGGIVGQILVKEGDLVEMGQPLILLDETAPMAEYDSLSARNTALKLQVERLRAFALGRPASFGTVPSRYNQFLSDQQQILAAQIATREAQISVINAQISEQREEIERLGISEGMLAEEVALMQEEVNIREQLIAQGLTTKIVYLSAQRDLTQARGSLADVRTQVIRAEAGIREASRRILELEERLRNDAFIEMGRVTSEQAQVEAELARLEDRVARTSISAPVSGRVKGLVIRPAGGVIAPGEVLMEIVPTEQELVAEVRISPRDIGHIEPGEAVLVKIETFNYARFGGIDGTLLHISASSFRDAEGNPFFKGRVLLSKNYVGGDPRSNQIAPGMTLIADIKTGEKTLMAYLMRPVYNTLQDSFGER